MSCRGGKGSRRQKWGQVQFIHAQTQTRVITEEREVSASENSKRQQAIEAVCESWGALRHWGTERPTEASFRNALMLGCVMLHRMRLSAVDMCWSATQAQRSANGIPERRREVSAGTERGRA